MNGVKVPECPSESFQVNILELCKGPVFIPVPWRLVKASCTGPEDGQCCVEVTDTSAPVSMRPWNAFPSIVKFKMGRSCPTLWTQNASEDPKPGNPHAC